MKEYIALVLFICLTASGIQAQPLKVFNKYLTNNNQVLFVKVAFPDAVKGTMCLYERKGNHKRWKRKDSFAVVVGRTGLARDPQTDIPFTDMPVKREGDGKSPAGIFLLGDVFSYHNLKIPKMPFVQVDTNFYCVDDVSSSYYNTLIVKDTAKETFNSFEYMKRSDEAYEYGVWVLYNSMPVAAGNGSCIFIHIWKDENTGTAGCTAMSKQNILQLIHWLNKKQNPVLLQVVENKRKGL